MFKLGTVRIKIVKNGAILSLQLNAISLGTNVCNEAKKQIHINIRGNFAKLKKPLGFFL